MDEAEFSVAWTKIGNRGPVPLHHFLAQEPLFWRLARANVDAAP
eukprot:gene3985-9697_t